MTKDNHALVDAIEETWAATSTVLHDISDDQWSAPTGCPGWSVKDVTAHLIWAARTWCGFLPEPIDIPLFDHVEGPFAGFMELDVHRRRPVAPALVLEEYDRQTVEAVASMRSHLDAGTFDGPFVGPMKTEMTRSQFLPTSVFDEWVHGNDIRVAVGSPAELTSAAADVGFSIAFRVLGHRAEQPVQLCLTGGRDDVVDLGEGAPVATIHVDAQELAARAAGRTTATGAFSIDGDDVAAHAVMDLLPITP